jgi:hypothetical protein
MSITRRIHRPIVASVLVALAMTSAAAASAPPQDLRSPDAREAAAVSRAAARAGIVVKPPQPAPVLADDGIDWGDAGIGAGSLLVVIALGLAAAVTIPHRATD